MSRTTTKEFVQARKALDITLHTTPGTPPTPLVAEGSLAGMLDALGDAMVAGGATPPIIPAMAGAGGGGRARAHCRSAPPRTRCIPDLRRDSVALFLKRQCGRTLQAAGRESCRTCWAG